MLAGLFIPAARWLYDYAWFVGFFVSGGIYVPAMHRSAAVLLAYELAVEEV